MNNSCNLDNGKTYLLLNESGKVVCMKDNKLTYKDLSEIRKISDAFTFWCCDLEELENFLKAFDSFMKGEHIFNELKIKEISFLEIQEEEDGSIVFC